MQDHSNSPENSPQRERHPFGDLHDRAIRAMPSDGNGQRKAFMDAQYSEEPEGTLVEASVADFAAESVENMAEVTAVAQPTLGQLARVVEAANADVVTSTRLAEIAQRDYNRQLAAAR